MSWTIKQIIEDAYSDIGLPPDEVEPDQMQFAARKLGAMIANWNAQGVRVSYPLTDNPENIDITLDSGIPQLAIEPVVANLVLKLAPSFGKVIAQETKATASSALKILKQYSASKPPKLQRPSTLPLGAGNKPWRENDRRFFPNPEDRLTAGKGDALEFN